MTGRDNQFYSAASKGADRTAAGTLLHCLDLFIKLIFFVFTLLTHFVLFLCLANTHAGQRLSGQVVALGLLRHPGLRRGLLHYEPHPRHPVRVSSPLFCC